jgi:hypothetical protein
VVSEAKWNALLNDRTNAVKKFWEKPTGNCAISDVQLDDPNNAKSKIKAKLIRIEIK